MTGDSADFFTASQAGQNLWVYGEVFNEARDRYFVDIGAHDGIFLSNTYLLEKRYGWNGICVEANPKAFSKLEKNRSCRCINACVDRENGTAEFAMRGVMGGIADDDCDNPKTGRARRITVETVTLKTLFEREHVPAEIDYLSIDIEGAEDRALLAFPFEDYRFHCLTIERPSAALRQVLDTHDYRLIKKIPDLDCFYIHDSFSRDYHQNLKRFSKTLKEKPWIQPAPARVDPTGD